MSCGVGHRCSSDLKLLHGYKVVRPTGTALIRPQPRNLHVPKVQPFKKPKKKKKVFINGAHSVQE